MSSSVKTSTIIIASTGAVVAGLLGMENLVKLSPPSIFLKYLLVPHLILKPHARARGQSLPLAPSLKPMCSAVPCSEVTIETNIDLLHTGYAVYFDHKRRSDPEFRKALKRESRREARAAKEQLEAQGEEQKRAIKAAVDGAKEEGFPTDVEDKETYFMHEVGQGEALCQDSMSHVI